MTKATLLANSVRWGTERWFAQIVKNRTIVHYIDSLQRKKTFLKIAKIDRILRAFSVFFYDATTPHLTEKKTSLMISSSKLYR